MTEKIPTREATAQQTDSSNTITIEVPGASGVLFGFNAIFAVLFLFAGWMIVGIGYLCVPGSIVGGFLGFALAFMNLGNGLVAAAVCLGCGVACFGLCLPILYGTRFLQRILLKQTRSLIASAKTA